MPFFGRGWRPVWQMGAVRITSWYQGFNGSHFGLPLSFIHRMTGLGGNFVWAMMQSHRTHFISFCWSFAFFFSSWTLLRMLHMLNRLLLCISVAGRWNGAPLVPPRQDPTAGASPPPFEAIRALYAREERGHDTGSTWGPPEGKVWATGLCKEADVQAIFEFFFFFFFFFVGFCSIDLKKLLRVRFVWTGFLEVKILSLTPSAGSLSFCLAVGDFSAIFFTFVLE